MFSLTPGLQLLLRLLLSIVVPAVVIYGAARVAQQHFAYDVPNWALLFAWVAYLPIKYVLRSLYQWIQEERDIRRLGAVRIPEVKGWLPGNLDVAEQLMTGNDTYMCKTDMLISVSPAHILPLLEVERVEKIQAQRGGVFCTKLLGENKVRCVHSSVISDKRYNFVLVDLHNRP